MVAAVGVASMLIALSFAEVSSRFDGTGGPYLYTRAAFGRFLAFEVGWMMWFTRAASWASVINVLVSALGFYWPSVTVGLTRSLLIAGIIATIAGINVRGIRQSSFVVNLLTAGKLIPLVIFIAVGLFYVDWGRVSQPASLTFTQLSTSALLLIFAFGGYEVVPVPGGETKDPRSAIPFALIMTIVIVTVIMTLAQLVALGTLPGLASSKTPLADAAALYMGPVGAAMVTLGAVMSTSGNNMGQALSGSRNLYALAEQGDLPKFFGYVHPRFRTPSNAILVTAGVALVLAVTGSFVTMAAASAISRLLVYVATCAAMIRLRASRFGGQVQTDPRFAPEPRTVNGVVVNPPQFTVPGGPVIAGLAIIIALAILFGATRQQLISGAYALAAGAVLYVITLRSQTGVRPGSDRGQTPVV